MQNGGGGKLDGVELQYEQPLDFIPGPAWLKDFGIKTNYTYITSEVDYGADTNGVHAFGPLIGQSKVSWNATLWYENDAGFSGRVSATYRDPYVNFVKSQIATVAASPAPGYDHTDKSQTIDASMSYKINDSIKVSLDMLNLTNESETTLLSDYDLPDTSLTSGRQYYLGVQYSF
jgi:TonB-dependent receptor